MAFLGSNSLKNLLIGSDIILPFNVNNIKNGAYELTLGEQVFQTGENPRAVRNLIVDEEIYINPGQFALLLTEETVKVPKNKIAFISIKAGIKFEGLVNVSGFHVDPGFEGKLLFSVYNAGPSTILLRRGKRYFPMWFAELNETQEYVGDHENQRIIPDAPIKALSQGELASPTVLSKRIDEVNTKLQERMGLIEKEQTAKDYLVKTAVGLGVIILIKLIFDWVSYDNGFKKAIELKRKELKLDSIINQRLVEENNLRNQRDSIEILKSLEQKKLDSLRNEELKPAPVNKNESRH